VRDLDSTTERAAESDTDTVSETDLANACTAWLAESDAVAESLAARDWTRAPRVTTSDADTVSDAARVKLCALRLTESDATAVSLVVRVKVCADRDTASLAVAVSLTVLVRKTLVWCNGRSQMTWDGKPLPAIAT
jgi:hypothetical protein